jgi:shikimate kinase
MVALASPAFCARKPPNRRRLPFQVTVYAIAGFLYKHNMTEVASHNEAIALAAVLGRRSLVLVGMMGAGKTSIGRRLAARMEIPFVDADAEIEKAAGMTVAEIFAAHGEPYFRAGEARVIARLLDGGPQVLATGGGAFMNPETRAAIRAKGVSVWLRAALEVLNKRVKRRGDRPLLKDANSEATLKRLIEQRTPVYAEADVTVESRDVPHETIVDEILAGLRSHIRPGDRPDNRAGGAAP